MSAINAERIRFVTQNYRNLQGLKLLPLAALLVVFSIGEVGWHLGGWWPSALVVAAVAAVIGIPAIGWWYRRRYGWVAPNFDRMTLVVVVFGLLVAAVVVLNIPAWRESLDLPVSYGGLLVGLAWIALTWSWRRFQPHWLVAGAVFAAVSLAPLGAILPPLPGLPEGTHPLDGPWLLPAVALAVAVLGILDHRVLVRELGAKPDGVDSA